MKNAYFDIAMSTRMCKNGERDVENALFIIMLDLGEKKSQFNSTIGYWYAK